MNDTLSPVASVVLPHHRLIAYRAAVVEAAAAVEIAALAGDASAASATEVARLASRVVALLTPLVR